MSKWCEICGAPLDDLEVVKVQSGDLILERNEVSAKIRKNGEDREISLNRQEALLLGLIMKRKLLSSEIAADIVSPDSENPRGVVTSIIFNLRKKIGQLGTKTHIANPNIGKNGATYRMEVVNERAVAQ